MNSNKRCIRRTKPHPIEPGYSAVAPPPKQSRKKNTSVYRLPGRKELVTNLLQAMVCGYALKEAIYPLIGLVLMPGFEPAHLGNLPRQAMENLERLFSALERLNPDAHFQDASKKAQKEGNS